MTLIGSWMEMWGENRGRAKLQELAEKDELTQAEAGWLERRLERHPEERGIYEESRRWLEMAERMQRQRLAPRPGLADRALSRARREEEREVQARVAARPRWTWSFVTGAVAVSLFAYAAVVRMPEKANSGASTAGWSQEVAPDLVLSSEAGPAEARSRFVAVVEAFGGRVEDRGDGVVAELPSEALLTLIERLGEVGRIEIENKAGALEDKRRIVVRLSFR